MHRKLVVVTLGKNIVNLGVKLVKVTPWWYLIARLDEHQGDLSENFRLYCEDAKLNHKCRLMGRSPRYLLPICILISLII